MDLRDMVAKQLDIRLLYKMIVKMRLPRSVKDTAAEAGPVCGTGSILLEKRVLFWQLDIWEDADKLEMV